MRSLCLLVAIFFGFASSLARYGRAPRASLLRARPFPRRQRLLATCGNGGDSNKDISGTSGDLGDLSLDDLFGRIKDIEPSAVPEDIRDAIAKRIKAEGPSDLEMRMNILGITPLTIAGFGLAAVILTLNAVLGGGWAADLLKMDPADSALTIERGDSAKARIRRAEQRTIDLSEEEIQDRIRQISIRADPR